MGFFWLPCICTVDSNYRLISFGVLNLRDLKMTDQIVGLEYARTRQLTSGKWKIVGRYTYLFRLDPDVIHRVRRIGVARDYTD